MSNVCVLIIEPHKVTTSNRDEGIGDVLKNVLAGRNLTLNYGGDANETSEYNDDNDEWEDDYMFISTAWGYEKEDKLHGKAIYEAHQAREGNTVGGDALLIERVGKFEAYVGRYTRESPLPLKFTMKSLFGDQMITDGSGSDKQFSISGYQLLKDDFLEINK